MKKMKTALLLGLIATLSFVMTGCGGGGGGSAAPAASSSAAEETTEEEVVEEDGEEEATGDISASVSLWTFPIGGWGDSDTIGSLIASFNERYPNIEVTVEYLDYAEGDNKINAAIEEGKAPDIVMEGPERLVANWGAKGLMVDLSDLFNSPAAGDIYANVKAACKSADGAFYEYPLCMVAHCMAINRDMFEAADALQYIDEETNTWTTEDFFKAVQAVYDSGQTKVGAVYCGGQGGDQGTRALINNLYGGAFTNADHTGYTVDSAENIRAIEELYAQDGIIFDPEIVGGDEIALFRDGTLAMSLCWNAFQQGNSENNDAGMTNDGAEIIPMLFPSVDGKSTRLCGGIWGFGIFDNGDADKIEAAKIFIDFMSNDAEQVLDSVRASSYFSVHSGVAGVYAGDVNEDVMDLFTARFMPSLGDYYQVVPGWATARTEWWNMLQRIGAGGDVTTEIDVFSKNANAAASE